MQRTNKERGMRTRHTLCALLVGWLLAGCATVANLKNIEMHIEGQDHLCRWHATDFRFSITGAEKREIYEFTLVLEETQGQTITCTQLDARFRNNPSSRHFSWQKEGPWTLPARGELRLPLGSYRYCPEFDNCADWGPLAPVWHLTLTGTDTVGNPVNLRIKLRLPYRNDTA